MTFYVDKKPTHCYYCPLRKEVLIDKDGQHKLVKGCVIDPEKYHSDCPLEELPEWVEEPKVQEALKPCPHCGCVDPVRLDVDRETASFVQYQVVCDYQKGGCGATGGWAKTGVEAIEKWNKRGEVSN